MTAVEFLKQEYIKRGDTLPSGVFQEALEMEKQQIETAYSEGETFPQGYLHSKDYYKKKLWYLYPAKRC